MISNNNIFKVVHNDLLPQPGRLLISEPFLRDAYFQRSVVLLVEHSGDTGSMGFILNKKTDMTINMLFSEFEHLPEIPIYLGGPVASNRLFFVHSLGNTVVPNSFAINDHLYFDGDFDALRDYMLSGNSIHDKVKFFIGYSGWEKGQLKDEIKANSWAVGHADDQRVFEGFLEAFCCEFGRTVPPVDSISKRSVFELISFLFLSADSLQNENVFISFGCMEPVFQCPLNLKSIREE